MTLDFLARNDLISSDSFCSSQEQLLLLTPFFSTLNFYYLYIRQVLQEMTNCKWWDYIGAYA